MQGANENQKTESWGQKTKDDFIVEKVCIDFDAICEVTERPGESPSTVQHAV